MAGSNGHFLVDGQMMPIQPNPATKDHSEVAPAAPEPNIAPNATEPKPTPAVSSVTKA